MSVPNDRLAELKHEAALQCARFAADLGREAGQEAESRGLCSAGAFERILEGGPTDVGLVRLIDFMFSLRDRIEEQDFGEYEHVEDEPVEDGPSDDVIPY